MSDAKHLQDLVRQARRKYNDSRSEKGDLSIPPFFASELWAIYRAIDAAFAEPETCEWGKWEKLNTNKYGSLVEPERTCEWTYDATEDEWTTGCGLVRVFSAMQPDYPGCNYCYHCGGKLAVIKMNNPGQLGDDKETPEPKYDGQIDCQKCGIRHPIGQPCQSYTGTGEPEQASQKAELEVAFEFITELRERVSKLEVMIGGKSPFPKCPSCGRSVVAKVNTCHEVRTYKCENKSCTTDTIRIERNQEGE